jgi:hypothetical protein
MLNVGKLGKFKPPIAEDIPDKAAEAAAPAEASPELCMLNPLDTASMAVLMVPGGGAHAASAAFAIFKSLLSSRQY